MSHHITKTSLQRKKEWELSHLGSPSLGIWPSLMETDWKKKKKRVLHSTACVKTAPVPSGSAHSFKEDPLPPTPVGISQAFGAPTPVSETLTQQGDGVKENTNPVLLLTENCGKASVQRDGRQRVISGLLLPVYPSIWV